MDELLPHAFGLFLIPLHRPGPEPARLIHDDLEVAELAERLGYDEFWIGEHHSGGWGTVTSPEVFLAAAAMRTSRIRLAAGVVSFPYHHPLMTAERAVLLDLLSHGRFILGAGAGAQRGDMAMLGIAPVDTPRRLAESAEVVAALLRGESVTRTSDWFELHDARLQPAATRPGGPPLVIASAVTPFGMQLAGRLGAQPLSFAAPPWGVMRPGQPLRVEALEAQWNAYAQAAAEHGNPADRRQWRLTIPVHVADDMPTARAEIYDGWVATRSGYFIQTRGMPISQHPDAAAKAFDATIREGGIVLGSPDECAAQIRSLARLCGGFGTLLLNCLDWAPREQQLVSLERFARQVVPQLVGAGPARANAAAGRQVANVAAQAEGIPTAEAVASRS